MEHLQVGHANHEEEQSSGKQQPPQQPRHAPWGEELRRRACGGVITWWDLADGGGVPAIALVTVGGLHEDGAVAEALCEDLPSDVVQPHASP